MKYANHSSAEEMKSDVRGVIEEEEEEEEEEERDKEEEDCVCDKVDFHFR
jgi:hypothetical protein